MKKDDAKIKNICFFIKEKILTRGVDNAIHLSEIEYGEESTLEALKLLGIKNSMNYGR